MQTVSLIDWILTMALVAAIWQMYETFQPQSHGPGEAEPAGFPPPVQEIKGGNVSRKLQRVREAGGFNDLDDFVSGAMSAYESVMTAYAAGRIAPVSALLAPDVRAAFEVAIADRAARGETLTMVFIGLAEAVPVDAGMDDGRCWITMRFLAQRVWATADREGRIIEGDPHRVVEAADIWTFARVPGSRDPNWVLAATGEDG